MPSLGPHRNALAISPRSSAVQLHDPGSENQHRATSDQSPITIQRVWDNAFARLKPFYLHEPAAQTLNIARQTVEKVFRERQIDVKPNQYLAGKVEKRIRVDYLATPYRSVAVQVLGRRGAVTSYMEQWGFRWRDLHDAHPRLLRVMLYDAAVQDINATATAIGEAVCDYFGPYDNVTRLHDLLDLASRQ